MNDIPIVPCLFGCGPRPKSTPYRDPPGNEPTVKRGGVHGSTVGLALHARTRDALCGPCSTLLAELLSAADVAQTSPAGAPAPGDEEAHRTGLVNGLRDRRLSSPMLSLAAHDLVEPHHLERFGVLEVRRYTERCGRGRVRTEIPCCARGLTTRARSVDLPVDLDTVRLACQYGMSTSLDISPDLTVVVCPHCALAWTVDLVDEGDDGYGALFALVGPVVLASARRTYRSLT